MNDQFTITNNQHTATSMELFAKLAPYLMTIFGSLITALLYQKWHKAKLTKAQTENALLNITRVKEIIDMWEEIATTLRGEIKTLTGEVQGLRKENGVLNKKIDDLINKPK